MLGALRQKLREAFIAKICSAFVVIVARFYKVMQLRHGVL